MSRLARHSWVLLFAVTTAQAGEWEIRGRVIDEVGKPIPDATVSHFWSGNGTGKHPDGTPLDLSKEEELQTFWGHLGQMEPRSQSAVTTGSDGSFSTKISDINHAIMVMDQARERGGVAVIPKGDEDQPIEIRLSPLVRVHGQFQGPDAGNQPYWTHIYVMVPEDPARPLDSCRLAHCGSFEARFEAWLPPGTYELDAYGQSTTEADLDIAVKPNPKFVVTGTERELDLGTFRLAKQLPSLQKRIERAKADGSWGDYTKHYGEPPPHWHATDARGVSKDVQLSDFRGKWVLVEFWGLSCRVCLAKGLPRLMEFYEEHSTQRDRFEILALCIDFEGELKTMTDVDRALEPIVQHVWGGKTLPFPVLLDPTFLTWERYGLPGLGTVILIDPEGKLVQGDESTLAEILIK